MLRKSVLETKRWLEEQPFSGSPAQMGSFVASRIEQHDDSVKFAEQGLKCNPDHPVLLNNLAFSSARLGDLETAKSALNRLRSITLEPVDAQIVNATEGLIAFREGDVARGRHLYENAIKAFSGDAQERKRECIAMAYHAMEEVRAGTPAGPRLLDQALELGIKHLVQPEDLILLKRLEDQQKILKSSGMERTKEPEQRPQT
jgi:hypothetical protein